MKLKLLFFLTGLILLPADLFAQEIEKKASSPAARASAAAPQPSVREILARYVQAIGGRQANERIKTRMMKGAFEMAPMNIRGSYEVYSAAPNKSYTKMTIQGIGDMIEGFDGTIAWADNPLQGRRTKEGEELLLAKHLHNFYRDISFDRLYKTLELKGTEKIGDREAYVVVGTPEGLAPETMYFDTQSGLLLRTDVVMVSPEGRLPAKMFFEDFRKVDGVRLPFRIRTVLPQFEVTVTLAEVKHGAVIPDSLFATPK